MQLPAAPNSDMVWYDAHQLESAWQQLPGGPDCEEAGETWQYMGSRVINHAPIIVRHNFRHRYHPAYRARVYVDVVESDTYCQLCDLRVRD